MNHVEILPKLNHPPQIWDKDWGKDCRCCDKPITKGHIYYCSLLWSMAAPGGFEIGYIHAACAPSPAHSDAIERALIILEAVLGYLPPRVYVHQYERPIVLGQRNSNGGKKIAVPATVLVNPATNAQLVLSLKPRHKYGPAFVYRPNYKGTKINWENHSLYTSAWYPISNAIAKAYWQGEMIDHDTV